MSILIYNFCSDVIQYEWILGSFSSSVSVINGSISIYFKLLSNDILFECQIFRKWGKKSKY